MSRKLSYTIEVQDDGTLKFQQFSKAVRDSGDAVETAGKKSRTAAESTAASLRNLSTIGMSVGTGLSAAITAPLVGLSAAAIKFGGDFEDAMTQSLAIMGDVSDEMKNGLSAAAKDMARTTVFSAKEGADALFFLASSGLDAASSIKALPAVAAFAQAGVMDLAKSSEFLTDAQSALGLKVQDATQNMQNMVRVSDVLVKANILSNATTQQFAEALTNKAAAALRLVNKDVEEGTAVLAAFASQGVKGSLAGEQLAIVMRDLQSKAIENKDAFKQLHVGVFDSTGSMRNMADIIGDLEKTLAGMSDEQKKVTLTMLGFQDRSVAAMLQLLGTSDAIRGYESALRSAGGTTDEIAKKQMESFKNQVKLLAHEVELLGITLFQSLAPILKDTVIPVLKATVDWIAKAAEAFSHLPVPVQAVGLAAAGLLAALGPLVLIGSSIAGSIGSASLAWASFRAASAAATAAASVAAPAIALTAGEMAYFGTTAVAATGATTATAGTFAGLGAAAVTLGAAIVTVGEVLAALYIAKKISDWIGLTDAIKQAANVLGDVAEASVHFGKAWLTIQWDNIIEGVHSVSAALDDLWDKIKRNTPDSVNTWAQGFIHQFAVARDGIEEFGKDTADAINKTAEAMDTQHDATQATRWFEAVSTSAQSTAKTMSEFRTEMFGAFTETRDWFNSLEPKTKSSAKTMADFRAEVFGIAPAVKTTTAEFAALTGGLDKGEKKLSDFEQQVKSFTDSAKKDNSETRALAAAIHQLEAAHVPASAIVAALGKNISDSSAKMNAHKTGVIAIIQKYDEFVEKAAAVTRAQEVLDDNAKVVNKTFLDQQIKLDAMNFFYGKFKAMIDQTADAQRAANIVWMNANAAMAESAQLISLMPSAKTIQLLPIVEPPTAPGPMPEGLPTRTWQQEIDAQKAAVDSMKESAGHVFDSMLANGKSVFSSLGNLFKGMWLTQARDMFSTITGELLGPLKVAFDDFFKGLLEGSGLKSFISGLGKQLGGALSKLLGGSGGGAGDGLGGLIKQFAPQAIKTALGIGGAAALGGTAIAGTVGTGVLAAGSTAGALGLGTINAGMALGGVGGLATGGTAAAAAGGSVGLGASIAALATNPVTIAAAAALAAVVAIKKIGEGRRTANEFVQGVENPFGKNMSGIVDSFNEAKKNGTLTMKDAQGARDALKELWDGFLEQNQKFAAQGATEAKVAQQSLNNMTKLFGENLGNIFSDIDKTMADKARNPFDEQYASFMSLLRPADSLNTELERLHQAFSNSEIVAVYADEIVKATEAQRLHGVAVSGFIADLEASARELLAAPAASKNPLAEEYAGFRNLLRPADDLNKELERLHNAFGASQIVSVYADQIMKAVEAQRAHGVAITGFIAELETSAKAILATEAIAQQAESFKKAMEQQADSFKKSLKPADDLNVELAQLSKTFSVKDIVTVYSKQILQAAEAQRQHGYAVTGFTAQLERSAIAYEKFIQTKNPKTLQEVEQLQKKQQSLVNELANLKLRENAGQGTIVNEFLTNKLSAFQKIVDDVAGTLGPLPGASVVNPRFPVTISPPVPASEATTASTAAAISQASPFDAVIARFDSGVSRFVETAQMFTLFDRGVQEFAATVERFSANEALRLPSEERARVLESSQAGASGDSGPTVQVTLTQQTKNEFNIEAGAEISQAQLEEKLLPILKDLGETNREKSMTQLAEALLEIFPSITTVPR